MSQDDEKQLSAFEKRLASLPPRPARLERDRLLFAAGCASKKPKWYWPCAALAASTVAVCLAAIVMVRPGTEPVVKTVYVQVPIYTDSSQPLFQSEAAPIEPRARYTSEGPTQPLSFWNMEQQALRFGVERLPMGASGEAAAGGAVQDRNELSAGSRPTLFRPVPLFSFGDRQ